MLVAARYSYTGALFSALQSNTILRYGDYQLRVDHPLGGGQATLFAFGALDDVGWTNPASTQEYGALQFHRLDLRWRRAIGGGRLLLGVTGGADWAQFDAFRQPDQGPGALRHAARRSTRARSARSVDLEVGANIDAQTFATVVPPFQGKQNDLGTSAPGAVAGGLRHADVPRGRSADDLAGPARRSVRRGGDAGAVRRAAARRRC